MRALAGLLLAVLLGGCASPVPSPSAPAIVAPTASPPPSTSPPATAAAIVIVRQADLGGNGLYTEGANAFIEIRTAGGILAASAHTDRYHLAQELLRAELPAGEYTLVTYVRPCEAACPAMDPPTDGCERPFAATAAEAIVLTVRRAVGQPCTVGVTTG